jgi:hypothetical protein
MTVSRDQLEELFGKRHLSYSSLKYAIGDMKLWDMYMRGHLRKETEALSFGTLYDELLFDRPKAMSKYVVIDEKKILEEVGAKNRSSKDFKERLQLIKDGMKPGQINVQPDDWYMANEMIERIHDSGLANLRLNGEYQVAFDVDILGVPIKGFLDCLNADSIVDSKTTKSIKSFKYSVFDFGYDIQAYIYSSVFGIQDYYWLAQEKTFPYLPADVKCSKETLFSGEMRVDLAIRNIVKYLNDENLRKNPCKYYESFSV